MWRRLIVGALSITVAACASSGNSTGRSDVKHRDSEVLSQEEMSDAGARDAYEAVTRLRPLFIKNRGISGSLLLREQTRQSVYLDNMRLGGIETLSTVPIEAIQSIRYLNAGEATYRWGMNHSGGVILLSTTK
jgi:hypothetical protein